MVQDNICPCGSNKSFSICCEPFLTSQMKPETAEQLMRSRYSAFVLANGDYLLNTWHLNNRPQTIDFDPHTRWLGLKVKRSKAGSPSDAYGWVEFVARYKIAGKAERIEELSYFKKLEDQWLYVCAEDKPWKDLV